MLVWVRSKPYRREASRWASARSWLATVTTRSSEAPKDALLTVEGKQQMMRQ